MFPQILRRKKVFAELQELVDGGGQEDIAAAQMAADNDETKERFRPSLVSLSIGFFFLGPKMAAKKPKSPFSEKRGVAKPK